MNKLLDLLPLAFAAVAGLTAALWGLLLSWEFTRGDEPGGIVAGLGMLLLGTPVLALASAAVVFWIYSLFLLPLRWGMEAVQTRRQHV